MRDRRWLPSRFFYPITQYVKLLPLVLRLNRYILSGEPTFVQTEGDITKDGVIREDFLTRLCHGKRVLHFGFTDSPFLQQRIQSGELLHLRLKEVAAFLFGVDVNAPSLSAYRSATGDANNVLLDIQSELSPSRFLQDGYDVVLLPEVLEHLENPGLALRNLRTICSWNHGAKLCVTVPNAFCAWGFCAALIGKEIVHPDHFYYFSPYTLRRVLENVGFKGVEILQYASRDLVKSPGLAKNGIIALCGL